MAAAFSIGVYCLVTLLSTMATPATLQHKDPIDAFNGLQLLYRFSVGNPKTVKQVQVAPTEFGGISRLSSSAPSVSETNKVVLSATVGEVIEEAAPRKNHRRLASWLSIHVLATAVPVVVRSLDALTCVRADVWRLRADMSIVCWEGAHVGMAVAALVFLVVWAVALTALLIIGTIVEPLKPFADTGMILALPLKSRWHACLVSAIPVVLVVARSLAAVSPIGTVAMIAVAAVYGGIVCFVLKPFNELLWLNLLLLIAPASAFFAALGNLLWTDELPASVLASVGVVAVTLTTLFWVVGLLIVSYKEMDNRHDRLQAAFLVRLPVAFKSFMQSYSSAVSRTAEVRLDPLMCAWLLLLLLYGWSK